MRGPPNKNPVVRQTKSIFFYLTFSFFNNFSQNIHLMNVIESFNLSKNYGKEVGIKNINLEIKKGEVYGFIGPNGAGKSTFIRTLLGFLIPTSGSAKIFGKKVDQNSHVIRQKIGYLPSGSVDIEDVLDEIFLGFCIGK